MRLEQLYGMCLEGPWLTAGEQTQYKVIEKDTVVYLVFQGSADDEDWLANFLFMPKLVRPYKDCMWLCHGGFARRWKAAREQILQDVLVPGKQVVVLGYSHGAAMALLAFEDLRYMGIKAVGYGFGGPRILWMPNGRLRARVEGFEMVLVRGDLVGHLPPAVWGYRHPQTLKIGKCHLPSVKMHLREAYVKALEEVS